MVLQAKVHRMIMAIRNWVFDPNLKAAELLAAMNRGETVYEEHEPSTPGSSEVPVDELNHEPLPIPDLPQPREGVHDELRGRARRHVLSGIVHIDGQQVGYLECGRKLTHNYILVTHFDSDDLNHSLCVQCASRAKTGAT